MMLLVLVAFPNRELAREVARRCIDERLAACAHIQPEVESVYRWEGKVEEATETPVVFKTGAARYPALEARIRELHPYEVPEVIALNVEGGLPAYLAWVADETAPLH